MSVGAVVRERLAAQWLAPREPRPVVDVVRHLLAVQAQDLQGARLAIRARSAGTTARDVDAALADRSLVVTWLNRGTLHLVDVADYPWLHLLTAPRTRVANARRLRQEGVSPEMADRGVEAIVRAIESGGPQTRAQLKQHLDEAGVRTQGQALVHVLGAASLAGLTVRGPMSGGDQAYVLVNSWLGVAPEQDRDEALARLAARYVAGHHPSTPNDLAAWAGIGLGDARRGLEAAGIGPGTPGAATQVPENHSEAATGSTTRAADPAPRLLGPFDPLLHGWPEREWLIGPYKHVITVNGIFRPTVLVGGRVVGTWTRPRGTVTLDLFEDVAEAVRKDLDADADDVTHFLG